MAFDAPLRGAQVDLPTLQLLEPADLAQFGGERSAAPAQPTEDAPRPTDSNARAKTPPRPTDRRASHAPPPAAQCRPGRRCASARSSRAIAPRTCPRSCADGLRTAPVKLTAPPPRRRRRHPWKETPGWGGLCARGVPGPLSAAGHLAATDWLGRRISVGDRAKIKPPTKCALPIPGSPGSWVSWAGRRCCQLGGAAVSWAGRRLGFLGGLPRRHRPLGR